MNISIKNNDLKTVARFDGKTLRDAFSRKIATFDGKVLRDASLKKWRLLMARF